MTLLGAVSPDLLWPAVLLGLLALDACLWKRFGDKATLSGWLGAWMRGSGYRVTWWLVVWAWLGPHILWGLSIWPLLTALVWATVFVFVWRRARSMLPPGWTGT